MKVTEISSSELDESLKRRWVAIQRSVPHLASPYFCPEFVGAVGMCRNDLRIGVIEDDGETIGFFPYHRRPFGLGRPVGLGLSDYHGVIIERDREFHVPALLAGCKLRGWVYDHLPRAQAQFVSWHTSVSSSPIVETSDGFEAYERTRRELSGTELTNVKRRMRKIARDHEPHRFEASDRDVARLYETIELKSRQCRTSGSFNYFSLGWTRELIERLFFTHTENFSGILSSVYVGEICISAHFGMRSNRVWHWWLPTFSKAFAKYSPGLISLYEVIRCAAYEGLDYVDLGGGTERYKRNLSTSQIPLASGIATSARTLDLALVASRKLVRLARRSASYGVLKPVIRATSRVRRRMRWG